MYRILLSSLVLLVAAADVSAQTTPANLRPSAANTKAALNKAATQTAAEASNHSTSNTQETYTTSGGFRDSADLKMQNVYAAPGMPVIVPDSKVAPYDGKAAESKQKKTKRKGNTTLSH
ncbi:hypothetical protein IC235_17255 [Hymenobacter sp. BT664]|uniref:Uncharacterized protein n=1 Tax=Hymenobacter montanus TaxID=2771359 RepID=A0A927BEZ1_9BACT|nr:hypothetical protein [Hymenobacter montanus]MBD2769640.1 hypothetical protein [Hymenobacter montanus]